MQQLINKICVNPASKKLWLIFLHKNVTIQLLQAAIMYKIITISVIMQFNLGPKLKNCFIVSNNEIVVLSIPQIFMIFVIS